MFTATSKKDLKNAETSDLDMNIIPMVEPEKQPKPSSKKTSSKKGGESSSPSEEMVDTYATLAQRVYQTYGGKKSDESIEYAIRHEMEKPETKSLDEMYISIKRLL
jgi:hypothetical protein